MGTPVVSISEKELSRILGQLSNSEKTRFMDSLLSLSTLDSNTRKLLAKSRSDFSKDNPVVVPKKYRDNDRNIEPPMTSYQIRKKFSKFPDSSSASSEYRRMINDPKIDSVTKERLADYMSDNPSSFDFTPVKRENDPKRIQQLENVIEHQLEDMTPCERAYYHDRILDMQHAPRGFLKSSIPKSVYDYKSSSDENFSDYQYALDNYYRKNLRKGNDVVDPNCEDDDFSLRNWFCGILEDRNQRAAVTETAGKFRPNFGPAVNGNKITMTERSGKRTPITQRK